MSSPIRWDELANLYDKAHGRGNRPARTLRMETIFAWAEKQTDRFRVAEDGTLHLIEETAVRDLRKEFVVVFGYVMHGFGARWTKGTAEHKAGKLGPQFEVRCVYDLVEQCQRSAPADGSTRGTFGYRGEKSDD